jgi:anti-sigma factor RsiW
MVAVGCEQVWSEISNYIDGEIDSTTRSALDEHFGQCARCTAVLEGTRNVVQLYGDDRLFQVPLGYSWRLKRRLKEEARPERGTLRGWVVAFAVLAIVAGSMTLVS